jgi:hypothetical protein
LFKVINSIKKVETLLVTNWEGRNDSMDLNTAMFIIALIALIVTLIDKMTKKG